MSILNPVFKSPFTDIGGELISAQWGQGPCADIEMKSIDCLEAYGLDRGLKKCDPLIRDYKECLGKDKQTKRVTAMRIERHRQHFAGERTRENKWSKNPPASDTF